ncbi:MAG: hypothetical protein ACLR1Z_11615 [Eubacterium sp.]|nr:MAG TPA: DNA-directed RNA polymerase [Bacteriophage sp.]
MKENEAIEKLKNMRLYMQITDKNNDCKFTEDDYKANEMAIQALEKQIPKKVVKDGEWSYKCPCCGGCAKTETGDSFIDYRLDYCDGCGQKLDWSDSD